MFLLFFLALFAASYAQAGANVAELSVTNFLSEPFAGCAWQYSGAAGLPEKDTGCANAVLKMQVVEAFASYPCLCTNGQMAVAGFNAKYHRFDFQHLDLPRLNLYTLCLPFDCILDPNERWQWWGRIAPGVFSDFKTVNRDDFKLELDAMATWRYTPALNFSAGVMYNSAFGDDEIYPIAGVVWRMHQHWLFNLLMPIPSVMWWPHRDWLFSANASLINEEWNLRFDDESGEFNCQMDAWQLGVSANYRVYRQLWLHGGVGWLVDQQYEISRDNREILETRADDAWFFKLALLCR